MPGRALLVVNPASRRGREALGRAEQQLEELGVELVPAPRTDPDGMQEIIQRERDGLDRVIVAGGDGTLNAALQGLVGTGLPLAILPVGTANNLARTLGIPASLEAACRLAAHGARRWIDVGWVNGRYFFTTASIGLSVQITEVLNHRTKQRWGALAYGVAAVQALTRSRPFRAELKWSGGTLHSRTVQVVVGNGRYYGSALPVAEDATIDDARLDVYSLEVNHWWELLFMLPALRRGRQGEKHSVETLRATELEIETRVPMAVNVDGEICSQTPARFRVVPGALEVFAPSP